MTTTQYQDPLSIFLYALKAPGTRRQYPRRLKVFLDYLKLEGQLEYQAVEFLTRVRQNPHWLQISLMQFISFQKERVRNGEISYSTITNYYKATKLFIEMNIDTPIINWKKISRGIPAGRRAAKDRAPTIEELSKISEYPDRRIKTIIYIMASPGIRLGAWDYLQWKHVEPMTNYEGEVIAAKLLVYAGESEQYYCFIVPAAYNALKEWMDYRTWHGEKITGDSWLMRDLWQTTDTNYGAKFGLATYPKRLKSSGIKGLMERSIHAQGLFKPLPQGVCRREWKGVHGMRKFYKTHAEQVMKPINVEITMGHDIGVSASYYKPTAHEVLEDYLKAIDLLTINGYSKLMQKQIKEIREKSKDNECVIKRQLQDRDEQIQMLAKKQEEFERLLQSLIDSGQLKPTPNATQ